MSRREHVEENVGVAAMDPIPAEQLHAIFSK
jgi:hypothetical protein